MSNTFFRFKQFTIHQQHAAMKVTTDACLFGAVVAEAVKGKPVNRVLDIGAGTGLLSLMIAQGTAALIDAVEIEKAAAMEAQQNFNASPWKERLQLFNTDIKDFNRDQYDLVISNPPFYEQDLLSPDRQKNAAKHDSTLTLDVLLQKAVELLAPGGQLALLLPFHRLEYCVGLARQHNLFLTKRIQVKHTAAHNYFRCILFFEKTPVVVQEETIIIKEASNVYTKRFTELLQEYYLYLPEL
jgi:tRNA1Val (adenine37-N6)-methyltransferase